MLLCDMLYFSLATLNKFTMTHDKQIKLNYVIHHNFEVKLHKCYATSFARKNKSFQLLYYRLIVLEFNNVHDVELSVLE